MHNKMLSVTLKALYLNTENIIHILMLSSP